MIIVFSGCGNTAATAARLAALTGDRSYAEEFFQN